MNPQSDVIGFSEVQCTEILEWFQELGRSCAESRAVVLASELGKALASYMDIDQEILSQAFLAECQRKRRLTGQ
jgi:hypothetical protein